MAKKSLLEQTIERGMVTLKEKFKSQEAAEKQRREERQRLLEESWKLVVAALDKALGELAAERVSLPCPDNWALTKSSAAVLVQFPRCAPIEISIAKDAKDVWRIREITRLDQTYLYLIPLPITTIIEVKEGPPQKGVEWSFNNLPGQTSRDLTEALAMARHSWELREKLLQSQKETPPKVEEKS